MRRWGLGGDKVSWLVCVHKRVAGNAAGCQAEIRLQSFARVFWIIAQMRPASSAALAFRVVGFAVGAAESWIMLSRQNDGNVV